MVSVSMGALVHGGGLFSGFAPPLRVRTGVRVMRGSCRLWSRMNPTKSQLLSSKKVSVLPNWMPRASRRKLGTSFLRFSVSLLLKVIIFFQHIASGLISFSDLL